MALERGLVDKDERVVLFNCATGKKYPMPDRSEKLALAERGSDDDLKAPAEPGWAPAFAGER